jgi:hypothetical protein
LQYCPSCGKSVDSESAFCPYCGHSLGAQPPAQAQPQPSPVAPVAPVTLAVEKVAAPLTEEQIAAGDRGLTSAVLNFLFWGTGYYKSGIERPFGRSWLIWPLIYVLYAFVGELVAFSSIFGPASGVRIIGATSGVADFQWVKTVAIVVLVVFGIILGLFLARDVYRREAASSPDPAGVPSFGAAIGSALGRATKLANAETVRAEPGVVFAVAGGILLILGTLYTTLLDWLSERTFAIGSIREVEGAVLGAFVVYVAIASSSRPSWRFASGLFIVGLGLIDLSLSTGYAVELGMCACLAAGGLIMASGLRKEKQESV